MSTSKLETSNQTGMKFEDFITIEVREGIGIIWLDHKFETMNIVSPEVIKLFAQLKDRVASNSDIKAQVLISKKPDFIAGADIKSFSIEKEGDFRPAQAEGHKSLAWIENFSKPTIAAINGACLGLGLEMALACHGRIASKSSRTKLGLPEVQLGILPGGGGTQRLPRLIGIQKALDMMLTGKNIDPYRAKKWGLVDELTDEGKLLQAAMMMAKRYLKKPIERKSRLSFTEKILESSLGRGILFKQAKKMALKQSQGNYPAIPAIIDCVETGITKGMAAGYEKELEHFERLMLTPESAALRSLFFLTTDNKKNPYKGAREVDTLGMIGAGFMGAGIAEITVKSGINVLLKDIKQDMINDAFKQIWKGIKKRVKYRSISKNEGEIQMNRLSGQLTYENFEHADVVIEAVLETMKLKKIIIDDIQNHGKEDVIIASNTSSLSLVEMADYAKKPENVVGMHYFSPVPKMPLLEIVKTDKTAEDVLATSYAIGLKQGKTCIVVNDGPLFYVNRILAPYTNECLIMLEEGLAIEDVDRALKKKGFPVGPITLLDQVGLDVAAHVTESSRAIVDGIPGFEISEAVIKMHADGREGRKNKKGFFKYNEKGKKQGVDSSAYGYFKGSGEKKLDQKVIQDRALMLMLNEAVLCLEEGIILAPKDGDLGAVFGIGFPPFTGGPFRAMDHWGIQEIVDTMKSLEATYGPRFTPAKTLVEMAEKGEKFHS
ncbi:MAG: 3-hydroxyacyl-CoA dehydrogenase NAD-binding domain-containing protein [Bacteroidota bacterium]